MNVFFTIKLKLNEIKMVRKRNERKNNSTYFYVK